MTRDETRGGRQLSDLGGARGLCGNKPPPGATWSQAAQQVRPSPHFQINCLIIAGLKSRPATTCRARWRNPSYWTRATTSSLDRAASTQLIGTPSLQVFSPSHHLKKLAISLELTGMASSSGLRARSLTLYHSITPSLRSPSVLSCAGLGPRERRGAERDSRAL